MFVLRPLAKQGTIRRLFLLISPLNLLSKNKPLSQLPNSLAEQTPAGTKLDKSKLLVLVVL